MRCNIQVSDVNASRTQRTNKQTDSRSSREGEAEGAGRERERETAAERGVNHYGQQGERQVVSRAGGHRAGHQAGSYACQDECHIIAPKMVSKRQQRPNCSCSPCFPCSGLFRVVILVNYESCSPAVLQSMGHQQQEQTHDTPRLSSSSRLASSRPIPLHSLVWPCNPSHGHTRQQEELQQDMHAPSSSSSSSASEFVRKTRNLSLNDRS